MAKKFDQESKDRVVCLAEDWILAEGLSMQQACQVVVPKRGVSWHMARQWTQALPLQALEQCYSVSETRSRRAYSP